MTGTVIAVNLHADDVHGSYGVLTGDDGAIYVWSCREVMRNGTQMKVGRRVTFEPAGSYANSISRVKEELHMPPRPISASDMFK